MSRESAPRWRTWWSVAALAIVVIGVVLVIFGLRGTDAGPGIPGPIGVTSAVVGTTHELRVAPGDSVVTSPGPGGASSTGPQTSPQPAAATATKNSLASSKTATGTTSSGSRPVARAIDESRPVHLSIPDIGLSEPVSELGLNTNGTVQAPTSWMVPGWYKFGPSPGEKGSAVILGHVDSVGGPAAFYRLSQLRPGDQVAVQLANGSTVRFKVIGLRMYLKTNFPDQLVYGPRPYSALQLVTCGGVFDSNTHHYLSNLVVYTALVS
jgi:LPXTG-site transpeptidase (sortase) family protein